MKETEAKQNDKEKNNCRPKLTLSNIRKHFYICVGPKKMGNVRTENVETVRRRKFLRN